MDDHSTPQPDWVGYEVPGQAKVSQSILEEAQAVVKDRQARYGSPLEHWTLTVALINRYFGTTFTPADWATCMVFDKLAREKNSHQRDNGVDVCGYMAGRETVLDEKP